MMQHISAVEGAAGGTLVTSLVRVCRGWTGRDYGQDMTHRSSTTEPTHLEEDAYRDGYRHRCFFAIEV